MDDAFYDADDTSDRVECPRCRLLWDVTETYMFGERSVCIDCTQDEIDALIATTHAAHSIERLKQASFDAIRCLNLAIQIRDRGGMENEITRARKHLMDVLEPANEEQMP
jgi:hypothetical protein